MYRTGEKTAKHATESQYGAAKATPMNQRHNNTGIPTGMKQRFETLSGYSFDDVKVHYHSPKPAQLQAHAYTQGNRVYIAAGQERHLEHELGHVIQQKAGKVRATEYRGNVPLNTSDTLEAQADALARASRTVGPIQLRATASPPVGVAQLSRRGRPARVRRQPPQISQISQRPQITNVRVSLAGIGEQQFATRHLITAAQSEGRIGDLYRDRTDARENTVILMTQEEFVNYIRGNEFDVTFIRNPSALRASSKCWFITTMRLRAFTFTDTAQPQRSREGERYADDTYNIQVREWRTSRAVMIEGECDNRSGSNCMVTHLSRASRIRD